MSGQPLQKPTDASKFRQSYLANLALQAKNNDVNLQGNKLFQRTGQIPIPPTDTRTTAEKYADVLRLKIELRQGLSQIMDGVNTERVVNQLDQNELIYLSNRISEVVSILKPKYKNGILATPFIIWLRKYEADELRNAGVRTGLQQSAGNDVLIGIRQIVDNMVDKNDLMNLEQILRGETGRLSQQILQEIDALINVIPSEELIRNMNNMRDQQAQQEVRELLNNALEDVPTKQELSQLIQDFQLAQNKRDRAQMGVVLGQLREILQVQREQLEQINLAEEIIRTSSKGKGEEKGEEAEEEPITVGEAESFSPRSRPIETTAENVPEQVLKARGKRIWEKENGYIPPDEFETYTVGEMNKYIKAVNKPYISSDGSRHFTLGRPLTNVELTKNKEATLKALDILRSRDRRVREFWAEQKGKTKRFRVHTEGQASEEEPEEEVKKEEGSGIRRHKMRGRGLGKKTNKEVFGDVVIHKPKLDNDIISIRKSNGSSVFKSKLVSNKLGNVVRTIHGGKIPSYDDYKDLSEDEKIYLHKLVKASGLMDKLNIPSPNKDEEDRDKNEFEIARGEILSGNDSPVLIKKFKTLIIKMMKRELISNNEGKELLFEIIALGH